MPVPPAVLRQYTSETNADPVAQTLLRFNFQPCSLAKPFDEMAIGFYIHDNMNFVVTERKEINPRDAGVAGGVLHSPTRSMPVLCARCSC